MSDPGLFDVEPWREATAADLKVGDWIKGLGWPWSWKYVIRARQFESGWVQITYADTPRGLMVGGYHGPSDTPVRIYNGTPPAEERAA